ncbi:hypothetical protein J6590_082220 [Homalodisca vitripennis]|nr:hypothetical protein J6590_082220 [Homalodisca vitripennis]
MITKFGQLAKLDWYADKELRQFGVTGCVLNGLMHFDATLRTLLTFKQPSIACQLKNRDDLSRKTALTRDGVPSSQRLLSSFQSSIHVSIDLRKNRDDVSRKTALTRDGVPSSQRLLSSFQSSIHVSIDLRKNRDDVSRKTALTRDGVPSSQRLLS